MALALVILADTAVSFSNAEIFYSDAGVLPRDVMREQTWADQGFWSLHALDGSVAWQLTLMSVQCLAALCLLAGWRTRLATILCWMLLASQDSRNLIVTNGADSIIRLLLFWSIFLPLAAVWSVDARRRRAKGGAAKAERGWSLGSFPGACLLLQVAFVYWFSVLFKNHAVWWSEGTALRQTLELDVFARPAAVWLRQHPDLCRLLTHGTLALEILGPLLAFLPMWRTGFRLIAVALMVSFHAGIALCMDIGAFPWAMMAAWLVFLPSAFWGWLGGVLRLRGPSLSASSSGGSLSPPLPSSRWRWLVNGFCAACLALVFMWNLRGTNFARWEAWFPRSVNPVVMALRLDQYWTMFAPTPLREDGWFILRAGMSDGSEIDLLRGGGPVTWEKPAQVSATFPDARWQKYLMNLWMQAHEQHRGPFGDCMARRWNAAHGGLSQVVAWQLWFVKEETQPDGTPSTPQPILMFDRERMGEESDPVGDLFSPGL